MECYRRIYWIYLEFHVEFLSSAIQFIEYMISYADDPNQRVFIQYEFGLVGFDDYVEVFFYCSFLIRSIVETKKFPMTAMN